MSRRWTEREDEFLHAYFEAIGDHVGTHDLGRPKGAATKRVKLLKDCGACAAMDRQAAARRDYRLCLGLPTVEHEEAALRGEYVPAPNARTHYCIRVEARTDGPFTWDHTLYLTAEAALRSWSLDDIRQRGAPDAYRVIAVQVTHRDVAGIEQAPADKSEATT